MNDHNPIYLTREDYSKLRLLLAVTTYPLQNTALKNLRAELDRAAIVDASALPPKAVTMGSRVRFEDAVTGETEEYTLVFPEQADVDQKRISILAPIGTALLGYSEGDDVRWTTPGGTRRIKIRQVTQPAAESASERLLADSRFG